VATSDVVAPELLAWREEGAFWDTVESLGITLLVTREYEHLVMAFHAVSGKPHVSYLPLPHPSGIAIDRSAATVHVASTRNPNQIYELHPVRRARQPHVAGGAAEDPAYLMPLRSQFLPGAVYLHDLAFIDGVLHANAVGENAVIRFDAVGAYERVWWPRCVEHAGVPRFDRNLIQLNSIAAGATIEESYFSASTDAPSRRRPGHLDFRVDGTGVVFSGRTRDACIRGLTRPHSARLHGGRVWVCNSGYGEVGVGDDGRLLAVATLPGWTRGLCFAERVAFIGTSRILPRFHHYAPGLEPEASRCGIHALDADTGAVLGRLWFPAGDQIFAVDWLPRALAGGLPFSFRRSAERERLRFFSFADPLFRDSQ
jgi:uncharacterized protein (TIGR03032 family)